MLGIGKFMESIPRNPRLIVVKLWAFRGIT